MATLGIASKIIESICTRCCEDFSTSSLSIIEVIWIFYQKHDKNFNFKRFLGYGDSSSEEPTERKVIEDAVFIYSWFSNKTKSNVFLWGHSLGTSIAIQTVVEVQDRGIKRPAGVILEAPFNNMKDEIGEFSIAKVNFFRLQYCYCSLTGSRLLIIT